jgi:hypothetical protein
LRNLETQWELRSTPDPNANAAMDKIKNERDASAHAGSKARSEHASATGFASSVADDAATTNDGAKNPKKRRKVNHGTCPLGLRAPVSQETRHWAPGFSLGSRLPTETRHAKNRTLANFGVAFLQHVYIVDDP